MSSPKASRRDFLKLTSAGVAGTALGVTSSSYARITGANDRVRVAICGVRGRGNDHIHGFSRVPNTEIAALCDVRSEEHTSELQSQSNLVCRLLLEKKKKKIERTNVEKIAQNM